MNTHIFNEFNIFKSEGKNLAILFSYARKFGVKKIHVGWTKEGKFGNREAIVNVYFANGWRGVTNFASFSNAVDWANEKSNRKNTFWTGCIVESEEEKL
jgi:hypothetical protein